MAEVAPLGVFGPRSREEFELSPTQLDTLRGGFTEPVRSQIAAYLRSGLIVLALMEYTRDVLDDRFGVSGGSAIMSDGRYYWRADAADYVEHYGIAIDDEVINWMRENRWRAPQMSTTDVESIDAFLYERLRSKR